MPALRISFLGSFQITQDGQGEIRFPNRKVMGLLAFLALEAGQSHSRETLMGLLWPELSEADARNNLRVTLARLRKGLGSVQTVVSPLTTNRTDVRFQLDEFVTLDAAAFQTLLAQTESHAHADRAACADCRERLAAAATLYRGPLLHGLYLDDCPAFDEWLFVQRERFHLQALELLEELAQGLAGDGRFAQAIAHTRRQLQLDPLHDSAQRRLLRLLAYQGHPAAALSQFEGIKKTLRAELGIEPDIELIQLAQRIKDGTLPAPGVSAAKTVEAKQAAAGQRHNLPEILTPFIGRESELAQLAERLASPAYRLITLAGPGGIGKTRLALEAARANLHRFADGAFFVPLDGVAAAAEVPAAIAAALNVTFSSDASPEAELLRILQEKQLLLVVDNLEHILEEGAAGLADFFTYTGLAFEGAQLLQTTVDSSQMAKATETGLLPCLLTRQLSLLVEICTLDEVRPLIERILSLTRRNPALAHLEAQTYLDASYLTLEFTTDLQQSRLLLDHAFASAAGLDDQELQGRLYAESGRNYLSDGQFDKAEAAFQKSLTLFESLGYISGQAMAYHFLAATYAESYNLGAALTYGLQTLRLRSQLNNRGRLGNAHLYLADTYLLLGAYEQAREHTLISLEIVQQQANKVQEAFVLFRYARILEQLAETEEAERVYRASITDLKKMKFHAELKLALLNWGDFLLHTGRASEATIYFHEALILNGDVDHLRLTTQAKLAQAYLAQSKSLAALALVHEVWAAVESTGGQGLPYPVHTMVECHTVFHACRDERAGAALQMAAEMMERTAASIEDPEIRVSFLNNVPVNREVQVALAGKVNK